MDHCRAMQRRPRRQGVTPETHRSAGGSMKLTEQQLLRSPTPASSRAFSLWRCNGPWTRGDRHTGAACRVSRPGRPRKQPVDPAGGEPQLQRPRLGGDLAGSLSRPRRAAQRVGLAAGAQSAGDCRQHLRHAQRQWRRSVRRWLALPRAWLATNHRACQLPVGRRGPRRAAGSRALAPGAARAGGPQRRLVVGRSRAQRAGRPRRVRCHHPPH